MASVASQLIEEVTAHAQSNSLEDAREICADGTYFPNNLRISIIYMLVGLKFTEQHAYFEVSSRKAVQEITVHLRTKNFCFTVSRAPSFFPYCEPINSVQYHPPHFFKIQFNVSLLWTNVFDVVVS